MFYIFLGCATITFLKENEFGITMKYGDRVLRNITLSGKLNILRLISFHFIHSTLFIFLFIIIFSFAVMSNYLPTRQTASFASVA